MPVINLTAPFGNHRTSIERLPIRSPKTSYTGMIYYFDYESMSTSYLDLPGHIAETDDGRHAAMLDPGDWYRQRANLIRIPVCPAGEEFAIRPADIEKAMAGKKWHPWMVINALGRKDDDGEARYFRMTYLALDTVDMLIDKGVKVIIGDAWESRRLDGVFTRLFSAGVCTVCGVANLHRLPDDREFFVTLGFLPYPGGVTQIPCSVLAEYEK